jgi:WD40 repeat protein
LHTYSLKKGLASAEFKVWNVNGKLLKTYDARPAAMRSIVISPNGKLALLKCDGVFQKNGSLDHTILMVLDLTNGKVIRSFDSQKDQLTKVAAFTPDSKFLVLDKNEGQPNSKSTKKAYLVLWDLAKDKESRRFRHRGPGAGDLADTPGPANAILFTPDGKEVFTADSDGRLRYWDFANGKLVRSIEAVEPQKAPPAGSKAVPRVFMALSPNCKVGLVVSGSKTAGANTFPNLLLWNLKTNKQLRPLRDPGDK